MKRVACLLSMLLLAACAGSEWSKPNAGEAELHQDSSACLLEAERITHAKNQFNLQKQQDRYARCMQERGWYR